MDPSQLLHRRISVISRTNIRYEGLLEAINKEEKTLVLSKVRALGTETRPPPNGKFIEPRDTVYEEICFHSNDLMSLSICEDQVAPASSHPTQTHTSEASVGQITPQHTANVQTPTYFNTADNLPQSTLPQMPPNMMPNMPPIPFANLYYGMPNPQNMNEVMHAQFYHYYMSYLQSQHMAAQGFPAHNGFMPQYQYPYLGQTGFHTEHNINQTVPSDVVGHQSPSSAAPSPDSNGFTDQHPVKLNVSSTTSSLSPPPADEPSSAEIQETTPEPLIQSSNQLSPSSTTVVENEPTPQSTQEAKTESTQPHQPHQPHQPRQPRQPHQPPTQREKEVKQQLLNPTVKRDSGPLLRHQQTSSNSNSIANSVSIKLHTSADVTPAKPVSHTPTSYKPTSVGLTTPRQPKSFKVGESIPVTIITRDDANIDVPKTAVVAEASGESHLKTFEEPTKPVQQYRRNVQSDFPRRGAGRRHQTNRTINTAADPSLLEDFDFVKSTLSFDKEKFVTELEAKRSSDPLPSRETPSVQITNYQKSQFFDNLSAPLGKHETLNRAQQRRVDAQTFGSAVKDYKPPHRGLSRTKEPNNPEGEASPSDQLKTTEESSSNITSVNTSTPRVAPSFPRGKSANDIRKNPPNHPHANSHFNQPSQDRRHFASGLRYNTHRRSDNPRNLPKDGAEQRSPKPSGQPSGFRGGARQYGSLP